jgi:hypothetical protein
MTRRALSITSIVAACISIPLVISAQDQSLQLERGTYVQEEVSCKDAPFAAVKSWDGVGLSGPHSSKCTTRVLRHHGQQFSVSTACAAIGDGTPNPSGKDDIQNLSVTRLSNNRIVVSDGESASSATYRWCRADGGIPNFPK